MSVSAGVPSARRTLPVATLASVRAQTAALLREHRGALIEVVGLHAIAAVAGLAAPFVVGRLVDEVTAGTAYESVDRQALWLAGAILAQTVLVWAARRSSFRLGERVFAQLREQFMTRVMALPLSTGYSGECEFRNWSIGAGTRSDEVRIRLYRFRRR